MSNGTPPIQSAPSPPSAPGIPQPVFDSGSATSPATPIQVTGAPIIPPPTIGDPVGFPVFPPTGTNTAPAGVPIGPLVGPAVSPASAPPSVAGQVQPQYKSGSATVPTAASLFPEFTTGSPSPPIVFANVFKIGEVPPPLPTTPGVAPIVISTAPAIPQLPWNPGPAGLPVNTARPAITGTPTVGSTLTASSGTWTNSPAAYDYEWLANGAPLAGVGNSPTLHLTASEESAHISVIVTAVNANGEASAESAAVGPIAPGATRNVNLDPDLDPDLPPRSAPKAAHRAPTKSGKKR